MSQKIEEKQVDKKKNLPVWLVVLIVLVFLGGCGAIISVFEDENGDENKETTQEEQKEIVDYKVVEEDDVSYAGYSRWSVRVAFSKSVKDTLTEKQFKDTSETIINDFIEKKGKIDEVNLFCYLEGQNYSGAYSVGRIVAKKDSGYSMENDDYDFSYEAPKEKATYETLGSYRDGGMNADWTAIKINSKMTEEELVELARKLHSENPEMRYSILNAKPSNFSRWKKYETNEVMNDKAIVKWNEKHYVAIINLMFNKEGSKWQLVPMVSDTGFNTDEISVDLG